VDVLQSWLVVGVPGLIVVAGLFVGRSKLRAWIGYGVLALLLAFFLLVPTDAISAAFVGLVAVVLVATGRGTHSDDAYREHHEDRKRFTTAAPEEH
jgi:hypothetical protein